MTDALAVLLGSQYVNDFDFNNRAYRVYVQGDQAFRAKPSDLEQYYARAANGDMVPLSTVVRLSERTAPAVINHFNLFRSAEITGSAVPGVSSGQALQEMQRIAGETLPAGFDFAWAGLSLEEIRAGSQAASLFGAEHRARVSRAGGPVRELGAAAHHSPGRAARGAGRAERAAGAGIRERRVLSGGTRSC